MDWKTFIVKVGEVLRKENPRYAPGSDRINNAQAFIREIKKTLKNPDELANQLKENLKEASNVSSLHPDRVRWAISYLK